MVVPNDDVVILVSSVSKLEEHGISFVFSDRHAYLEPALFYNDPLQLNQIDWEILQRRDFKYDPNDPGKVERYQAELLAYRHVPTQALIGIVCYNGDSHENAEKDCEAAEVSIQIVAKPDWYFL
jgi:hypothetical protein